MSAYVVYGTRSACIIRGGFACTREELPGELARVAGPVVGLILGHEWCESVETAQTMAVHYTHGCYGGTRTIWLGSS